MVLSLPKPLESVSGTFRVSWSIPQEPLSISLEMEFLFFMLCTFSASLDASFFFSKVILSNVYWHQQYRANIFPLLSLLFCVSWVIKSMCQDILGKYLWNIKEKEKEGETASGHDAGLALVKQRGKRGLGRKSLRSQHSLKNASARMLGNPQAVTKDFYLSQEWVCLSTIGWQLDGKLGLCESRDSTVGVNSQLWSSQIGFWPFDSLPAFYLPLVRLRILLYDNVYLDFLS